MLVVVLVPPPAHPAALLPVAPIPAPHQLSAPLPPQTPMQPSSSWVGQLPLGCHHLQETLHHTQQQQLVACQKT
eukprot:12919249-Ditylum_brightwellii.AAC.1